ncbi:MAG TPA: hypothetical protein VMG82_04230 [Candidatus Sulfotelmatobacter sp.]|nr:hypothetical protein [Candidatus Sulfotelmatobacter sp.]
MGACNESELGVAVAQTFYSSDAPVSRAIIYDPEHTAGIIVGRSGHDLLDQAIKRIDAILGFAATEDSRMMDVQTRDIGPGAAAGVFVLDSHGRIGPALVGCLFAAPSLNAVFFVGRDDEFIIL